MEELRKKLNSIFTYHDNIYRQSNTSGYWSNLSETDQVKLLSDLEHKSTRKAIQDTFPQYYNMIFDPARAVGLKLLEIGNNDIGIDYGCMWGSLLVVAARHCKAMLGIDQTIDSLKFLNKRLQEEKIENCFLLNANLRNGLNIENTFDFAIVNGVLEWIPEQRKIELTSHFKRRKVQFVHPEVDPKVEQLNFLKSVVKTLKKSGKLYLAIENKFDYQYLFWKKDPHSNLHFTTFLPRFVSNIISNLWYGRPYINYIYSIKELKKLLSDAGFDRSSVYASFPDYHFPMKIIPIDKRNNVHFAPVSYWRKRNDLFARIVFKIIKCFDIMIFAKMRLFVLAPAFIIIAQKRDSNSQ